MKRKERIGALSVLSALSLIVTGMAFLAGLTTYAMVASTMTVALIVALIMYVYNSQTDETVYNANLKNILKTFDSILVKTTSIPDLKKKNIMRVESIDDLINAQIEIRKPIYYLVEEKCCSFILLGGDEVCLYVLKQTEDVVSSVEEKVNKIEEKRTENDAEKSLFDDIDKTMIIKLENLKSYKVSPISSDDDSEEEVEAESKSKTRAKAKVEVEAEAEA